MRTEDATIRGTVPTPLAAACDCELSFTTGGDAQWFAQSAEYYIACPELAEGDNDAAQSGTIGSGQETWMQTTVVGPGNVSFRYKMSSVSGDGLAFYVDESFKASWSQGSSWPWTGNFAVPSGTHTLKWKYYKYSGSTAGSCWVDAIQWSGGVPGSGGGADWEQITYTYDPSGRRIAKDVDGVVTKYGAACPVRSRCISGLRPGSELVERDGDHCIAEYDGSNNLLRKYIHGPCIDEPRSASLRAGSFCMVEEAGGYAGTYYYHFDALGSVVALSDAAGDTVQVYEYDVYGQVAASDPNHPNRFLFTGREFDTETGLYYYRARYYNPTIGRFLQTDPIGYGDGMNVYAYCGNNATNSVDPYGLAEQAYAYVVDGDSVMYLYDDPEVWGTYKWNTDGVSYHYAVAPEGLLHVGDIGGVPVFVVDRSLGAFSIESLGYVTLGGEREVTDASICEAVLAMSRGTATAPFGETAGGDSSTPGLGWPTAGQVGEIVTTAPGYQAPGGSVGVLAAPAAATIPWAAALQQDLANSKTGVTETPYGSLGPKYPLARTLGQWIRRGQSGGANPGTVYAFRDI